MHCNLNECAQLLHDGYIDSYITLHYITLHYITLHYITLHYITLMVTLCAQLLHDGYIDFNWLAS